VLEEFVKRLQLPEARYSFALNGSNNAVELIIFMDWTMVCTLSIGNGTMRVLYDDRYESDKYSVINFLTPISMLYYLCVFFYKAVSLDEESDLDFNNILSVVLLNEIYDWKTLVQGLSDNLGMEYADNGKFVTIEGIEIHYNGFTNVIKIDTQKITLDNPTYTYVVEAMFKTVEYVANVMDMADDLFNIEEEEENNLIEEEEGEESEGSSTPMDMDIDVDVGGGGEEVGAEPVPAMENETFEEPQGTVVTPEDVI
jgi:hypothetical protein